MLVFFQVLLTTTILVGSLESGFFRRVFKRELFYVWSLFWCSFVGEEIKRTEFIESICVELPVLLLLLYLRFIFLIFRTVISMIFVTFVSHMNFALPFREDQFAARYRVLT